MASADEEFLVYLSSLGSTDVHPENVPGSFQNKIIPIGLNPNRDYQIALHGIFIPREVYTLHKDDNEAVLEIYTETNLRDSHGSGDNATRAQTTYSPNNPRKNIPSNEVSANVERRQLRYSLKPPRNITSKEISVIVDELNTYWFSILKGVFGISNYQRYFDEKRGIVSYTKNYVCYHKRSLDGCNGINYCTISLVFKPRLASILGFIPNHYYDIFVTNEGSHYPLREVNADFPPDPHADVDYLHLYCDVIQPTRFAGQMTNILATLPYGASNNYYSVLRPLYKKMSKHAIDSIAILVTDQYGRKIYFEERRSATIILHIRPAPTVY